jgi:cytosine deaminase
MMSDDAGPTRLAQAMDIGADVVGGIPWIEPSAEMARAHVDVCFDLALRLGRPLHLLVDETDDGTSRTLEVAVDRALQTPVTQGITISHATAMASWPDDYALSVLRRAQQANIHFSCNAHENLMLMGSADNEPVRRGIMRVREMQALGINILSAQDSVVDPYYPFGRMNQLEVAWILGHAIRAQSLEDVEFLYDAISVNAAHALQLPDYGCEIDDRANLVVIGQPSVRDALRFMGPVLYTIKNGRITSDHGIIVRDAESGP